MASACIVFRLLPLLVPVLERGRPDLCVESLWSDFCESVGEQSIVDKDIEDVLVGRGVPPERNMSYELKRLILSSWLPIRLSGRIVGLAVSLPPGRLSGLVGNGDEETLLGDCDELDAVGQISEILRIDWLYGPRIRRNLV